MNPFVIKNESENVLFQSGYSNFQINAENTEIGTVGLYYKYFRSSFFTRLEKLFQ